MLKIGGTATANTNVLNGTRLQTLYRKARVVIRAVASADAPTVPTVTCDFESGSESYVTDVFVRTQDQGVAEEIGPGPDNVVFDGMVDPGSLRLIFSAACYWDAAVM